MLKDPKNDPLSICSRTHFRCTFSYEEVQSHRLFSLHGKLILLLRLGRETRVPLVIRECFDIVQDVYDVLKKIDLANFEFLKIHICLEGVEIGS